MKIVLVFLFGVFCVTASRSSQAPDMVFVPAGEFQMGSNKSAAIIVPAKEKSIDQIPKTKI